MENDASEVLHALKRNLTYDGQTGQFTWLPSEGKRGRRIGGGCAGYTRRDGYVTIQFEGYRHLAHRLVWLLHYGVWPVDGLDHIDRDPANNRLENLRPASSAQNMQNVLIHAHNASGHKGVNWHKASGKWRAFITVNKQMLHLGLFTELSGAVAARRGAERAYFTHSPVHVAQD